MDVEEEIKAYISSLSQPKCDDMWELHRMIQEVNPGCNLWFLDGKDSENKTVSNPNIGYGLRTIRYAGGKTREFYQVGISANSSGISVYILGFDEKTHLAKTYGGQLGKAAVTGYCIKFRAFKDIHPDILKAAIREGFRR